MLNSMRFNETDFGKLTQEPTWNCNGIVMELNNLQIEKKTLDTLGI